MQQSKHFKDFAPKKSNLRDMGQGTCDKGHVTRDMGQGTRDKGLRTRNLRQDINVIRFGTRDKEEGTRDKS